MKEITITEEQFREIATDVAATMATDFDEDKAIEVLLITALFSATLHNELFNKDTLEVEE